MLKEEYNTMSKQQKTQVVKWLKEQIVQKYFNCTMRPPSDTKQSKKLVRNHFLQSNLFNYSDIFTIKGSVCNF